MSENVDDLEAGGLETMFNAVVEQVSSLLFQINNNINNIRKMQMSLTARFNSSGQTGNVSTLQGRIVELVNSTAELFKQLNTPKSALITRFDNHTAGFGRYTDDENQSYKDSSADKIRLDRNQSLQKEKILREIATSLQEFQAAQLEFKQFIEKRELNQLLIEEEEQKNNLNVDSSAPQHQLIKELDPINNEELVYHTQMISQREEEIQNIETSILELNTIFKDLDTLVSDQGYMIDNIETNINSFSDHVRLADSQLVKANRSQRRSLKTKKCLILVCVLVLVFLMFIVLALT